MSEFSFIFFIRGFRGAFGFGRRVFASSSSSAGSALVLGDARFSFS